MTDYPKTRADLKGMVLLAKVLRFARPVLSVLGWKMEKKTLDDVVNIGEHLLSLAEKFNPTFASRGWIASNAINTEAAKAALDAAGQGQWEKADTILAEAYSPIMVRVHLRQMAGLRCFKSRHALAMLAVDDYEAERYHACVPVALALLDGMGQELTGANFFRNTTRIKPNESFLEIGPGVAELLKTMSRSRQGTTTAPIAIPYRHGILHGTDLGYNNRIVAAKAWAALLAVGHYASDYLTPPPEPAPSLMDTLRRSAETQKRIAELEAAQQKWKPRSPEEVRAVVGGDFSTAGTPEFAAATIFRAWQSNKFGIIAEHSTDAKKLGVSKLAGQLRRNLGRAPDTVRIVGIEDSGSAAAEVVVRLSWAGSEADEISLRMAYHKDDEIAPRTIDGGKWLLVSLWPLECARPIVVDDGGENDDVVEDTGDDQAVGSDGEL